MPLGIRLMSLFVCVFILDSYIYAILKSYMRRGVFCAPNAWRSDVRDPIRGMFRSPPCTDAHWEKGKKLPTPRKRRRQLCGSTPLLSC